MSQITINKALVLLKTIKTRISELSKLREDSSSVKRTWLGENTKEEKIPVYDVKELDKKILSLQRIALNVEINIKDSNSVTKIDIPDGLDDELFRNIV